MLEKSKCMHSLKNGIMGKEGKLQRKQRYKKDQDECTVHMKWRELNVFQVFGYGRVHLVLRLRSSKAEPAKAESQFKLVRSDRKEQQEAQVTLKKKQPTRPTKEDFNGKK